MILAIIDKLLTLLLGWVAIKEQKDAQEQRDEVEAAPAEWFDHHFDSLHNYHEKAISPQTDPQRPPE